MKQFIFFLIFILTPFLSTGQQWLTDLDKALQTAKGNDRPILLVFQGSDWCAPCIKLDREIWQSNEFKEYAKKHLVLLKADFPKKKKHQLSSTQQEKNKLLAEKYNQNGYFPLVVILDKNGNVVGETGYRDVPPEKYIKILESIINPASTW